jgi:4-hydroxy-tetrahydrodipicolinate reductase
MTILILGRGKTGSLAAEVAVERKQNIRVIGAKENISCGALTAEKLRDIDIVIDFTAPHCVLAHIEACVQADKNMVVGTTGWYDEIDRVRALVEQHGTGFVYSPNFSVGVNLFLDVARAAASGPAPRLLRPDFRAPSRSQERRALRHRDRAATSHARGE